MSEPADRLIADGNRAEAAGRVREACERYRDAVRAAPGYAKAHLNLGIALEALGDATGAMASHGKALELDAHDAYAAYNLGRLLYSSSGELQQAEQLLRCALESKPAFPEASIVLSHVLHARGRTSDALLALEQALEHRPDHGGALRTYGVLLSKSLRWKQAAAALHAVLTADPRDPEAAYLLGNALVHLERPHEALASYRKAVDLQPDLAAAWTSLGSLLCDLGRRDEARHALRRALELQPESADALLGLGNVCAANDAMEEAADYFRRALALDAGLLQARINLGNALKYAGRRREALACFDAAIALDPSSAQARWAQAMCQVPVIREAADDLAAARSAFSTCLQELEALLDAHPAKGAQVVGSEQPFWLAYHEHANRDILQRYGRLCARLMAHWQDAERLPPVAMRRRAGPPGPLRVGIVSQYFRDHSVWQAIIKGWLQQLDRRRFAISAFCLGADQDGETAYARARAASFEQAAGGLRPWVERIRAAEPEVLLYPEIGMDPMTLRLASLRLAPVQAAAWGHPETSGLPSIDLYLSAQDFEPGGAQDHYTERLVALPHLGCYVEPSGLAASAQPLERAVGEAGEPLLLCAGTPFKYAPEHDWIFPEIARGLGRCRFVFFVHRYRGLSEKLRARLAQAFRQAGVAFERHVVFVPWQRKPEFYGWLRRADVFLDTIGFSGFNTALQAIECGLPVVTREGRFMRGRLASGILKRMQLEELVAESEKDYVSLAVRLASEPDYRRRICAEIAKRRGVLFNDRAPIAALEELLESLR